jgi:glycosyltransferase involved in cell wall biosynthesis
MFPSEAGPGDAAVWDIAAADLTSKERPCPRVSAIIPCLNEEKTIGICIRKAFSAFARLGVVGEVVVGDNGSSDGSTMVAESLGARVIHQPVRGYGAAIRAAAEAARGEYLIMADADDSYDWSDIGPFIDCLDAGADLVMGNRFGGGIQPGAMPALHRYLGNPVLSSVARWLYQVPVRDFHCGMRGFTRDSFAMMAPRSTGMEFASEMVINAHRAGLDIREVAVKLYPDKRGRPPHLRSFKDGWRHLRLIIAHAPDQIYLIPGGILLLLGMIGLALLASGPMRIGGFYLGTHFVALASMMTLIGLTAILLGVLAKLAIAAYQPVRQGWFVPWLKRGRPLEWLLVVGGIIALGGLAVDVGLTFRWILIGGNMERTVHLAFVSTTACVAGFMMILTGFVLQLLLDNLEHR